MSGCYQVRFVVKTDNDKHWLTKLHPFNASYNNDTLTVDLNSWHAFSELERLFGAAPQVFTARAYPQTDLPVINFVKSCG